MGLSVPNSDNKVEDQWILFALQDLTEALKRRGALNSSVRLASLLREIGLELQALEQEAKVKQKCVVVHLTRSQQN